MHATYIDKLGATRQKAFSHKVRSGCLTCKRRRVKCDETRPACQNCTRANRKCLGYDTPKPKLFTLEGSSSETTAARTLPSPLSDATTDVESLLIPRPPKVSFGNAEENNFLQHWVRNTSQMLEHYSPETEFYTIVVPQLAWQSPVVKHMMVALSMTHSKFQTGVTTVSKSTTSRALTHYISAITDIRKNSPSKLEVAVASLIAWTLELMQNNVPAALTHLRATIRLLNEHKELQLPGSVQSIVQKSLIPTASLAKGLTGLMLQTGLKMGEVAPEYRDHIHTPWAGPNYSSIVEARSALCVTVERIAAAKTPEEIREPERLLSWWWETARRWDVESARSPDLTALFLLFYLGMALLPGDDVAGFSYDENPDAIKSVVDSAAKLVATTPKSQTNDQWRETLQMVLGYVVNLFPEDLNRSRAAFLLKQLRETT